MAGLKADTTGAQWAILLAVKKVAKRDASRAGAWVSLKVAMWVVWSAVLMVAMKAVVWADH